MRRRAGLLALLLLTFLAGWFGHSLFRSAVEPKSSLGREAPGPPVGDPRPGDVPGLEAAPRTQPVAEDPTPRAPNEPTVAPRSGDAAGGTLRVRVREFSGAAVPGIVVRLLRTQPKPESRDATTGSDGAAEFAGLAPGEWRVESSFPEGTQFSNMSVYAGHLVEVTLVHPARGVLFEGTVRDPAKGPVEGVTVTLSTMEGGAYATLAAKTDSRGAYRFEGVRPGGWNVFLSANASRSGFSQSNHVFVPPGETFRKDFVAGALLRGTVRDRSSRSPIAGVSVQARQRENYLDTVSTDAEGAFGFKGLNPGTFELMLSRSGYGFTIVRNLEVTVEGAAFDLEMSPAARLRLHVTDAKGQPTSGSVFIGVSPKVEGQGTAVGTAFHADVDGRGSYDEILPGAYLLHFSVEGLGAAQVETTLVPGDNSLEVRLGPKEPK